MFTRQLRNLVPHYCDMEQRSGNRVDLDYLPHVVCRTSQPEDWPCQLVVVVGILE